MRPLKRTQDGLVLVHEFYSEFCVMHVPLYVGQKCCRALINKPLSESCNVCSLVKARMGYAKIATLSVLYHLIHVHLCL